MRKFYLVVGYRKFNEDMVSDSLLFLNMEHASHNFLGVWYFNITHMKNASYQMALSLRNQRYMAFTTHFVEYKSIQIPTGILLASKF
jgi:hypothetical protein